MLIFKSLPLFSLIPSCYDKRGRRPAFTTPPSQPQSWAQITSSLRQPTDNSPLHNPHIFSKLKDSTTNFVHLDNKTILRAGRCFQYAHYGKFFGKSPLFSQVKTDLLSKWASFGKVSIYDLPNKFMLIRCPSQQVMHHVLLDGPWSVNGIIL